ncbi:hypothetical protein [Colwellia sp. MEBiC06753]
MKLNNFLMQTLSVFSVLFLIACTDSTDTTKAPASKPSLADSITINDTRNYRLMWPEQGVAKAQINEAIFNAIRVPDINKVMINTIEHDKQNMTIELLNPNVFDDSIKQIYYRIRLKSQGTGQSQNMWLFEHAEQAFQCRRADYDYFSGAYCP